MYKELSGQDYREFRKAQNIIEGEMEYYKWVKEIPFICFPDKYEVKIIPPFGGAVVRFLIQVKEHPELGTRSIYLDCYDILGSGGEPYWELFPCETSDVFRCPMNDTQALLDALDASDYSGTYEEALDGQA